MFVQVFRFKSFATNSRSLVVYRKTSLVCTILRSRVLGCYRVGRMDRSSGVWGGMDMVVVHRRDDFN